MDSHFSVIPLAKKKKKLIIALVNFWAPVDGQEAEGSNAMHPISADG